MKHCDQMNPDYVRALNEAARDTKCALAAIDQGRYSFARECLRMAEKWAADLAEFKRLDREAEQAVGVH